MKYLLGFLRFWRNFIIGDDPTIAIAVLWSFLAVHALIKISMPSWYVVPVIVTGLFIVLLSRSLRTFATQHTTPKQHHTSSFHTIDALWMPMFAVVILPFCLFRIETMDISMERTVLPLIALCLIIGASTLTLVRYFNKYPAFISSVAGVISFALINRGEALLLNFFGLVAHQMFAGMILLLLIGVGSIVVMVQKMMHVRQTTP